MPPCKENVDICEKALDTNLVKLKVGGHPVHEADKAPESVNFVFHHKEERGEEV